MPENKSTKQQKELAEVTAALVQKGHEDLASDIIILANTYNGTHVFFDDRNTDSVFMNTLHTLLDELGFKNILRISREKAGRMAKAPPAFNSQYPGHVSPIKQWG